MRTTIVSRHCELDHGDDCEERSDDGQAATEEDG